MARDLAKGTERRLEERVRDAIASVAGDAEADRLAAASAVLPPPPPESATAKVRRLRGTRRGRLRLRSARGWGDIPGA